MYLKNKMNFNYQTITITFGDRAENHIGMQQIGTAAERGFSIEDLENSKMNFEQKGCTCELVRLNDYLPNVEAEEAKILIIRGGVNTLLADIGRNANNLFTELKNLDWDKKAKMYMRHSLNVSSRFFCLDKKLYGRVVNKNARYNLCLDSVAQEPNYEEGRGRIVAYQDVPNASHIRNQLAGLVNGGGDLAGELNNYQDVRKMGIGFHGDSERLKVIAVRVGETIPIHYQWFYKGSPIGNRAILPLHHGDMYIMSQKTTGNDWKKKNIYTLRHATGCEKFTTIS